MSSTCELPEKNHQRFTVDIKTRTNKRLSTLDSPKKQMLEMQNYNKLDESMEDKMG